MGIEVAAVKSLLELGAPIWTIMFVLLVWHFGKRVGRLEDCVRKMEVMLGRMEERLSNLTNRHAAGGD